MPSNLSFSSDAIHNLAQHIASLQKRVNELEGRLETTNDRLMDLARASKDRFERMQSVVSSLEYSYKKNAQDVRTELTNLANQITQRRVADSKIQDLIGKHNQMVGQFEQKAQELKRLISGQDMKLLELDSRMRITEAVRR